MTKIEAVRMLEANLPALPPGVRLPAGRRRELSQFIELLRREIDDPKIL